MSVLEEDQLETLKQQSQVVATNGSAANSKNTDCYKKMRGCK